MSANTINMDTTIGTVELSVQVNNDHEYNNQWGDFAHVYGDVLQ